MIRFVVMAGLVPAINVFASPQRPSRMRGCPDQVRAWRSWKHRARSEWSL